ncbi:hypothetical protein [Pseudomonas syringae]|uniref:hypothetical protein n=1 Tax=Pseudomonas syringae TaxID=317 RepID=UPI001F441738|nr:hypothetical protein [Pseudomonas syringae]MCF5371930.1 hypothetical protein [Pseudomonas syringae]MCF5382506.1 hypothetical protein [Pseudomonas syringae]MCF5419393.1 hypothetical protein [Pseudomonas syringae]MCF5451940.1 hypothetical protein [Pseudomonas syringae]MCF5458724.1 hypothetical protein [Pseudomonas syringae]
MTSTNNPPELIAGALFVHKGVSFRLNTFMCEVTKVTPECPIVAELVAAWEAEDDADVPMGMRRVKLRHCLPEEATYVSGSGVCGCVVLITEIELHGMVRWSPEQLHEHHQIALQKGREGRSTVTIVRPIPQQESV